MQKFVVAVAALLALAFASPAWSIVQEQVTTATNATPSEIKSADIIITQTTTTSVKTDTVRVVNNTRHGQQRVRVDTDNTRRVDIVVNIVRQDGKTEQRKFENVDLTAWLGGGQINLGSGLSIRNAPFSPTRAQPRTPAPTYSSPTQAGLAPAPSWTGFYIGANSGYGWGDSTFTPFEYWSANNFDPTNRISTSRSSNDFNAGIFIGTNLGNLPVATEVEIKWLNNKVTIPGLPGLGGGFNTAGDSLTIRNDWLASFSGFFYIPGLNTPDVMPYVKGGIAVVHSTFEFNCQTFCAAAPASPAGTFKHSQWNPGLLIGAGLQFRLPWLGNQTSARIGWDYIFMDDYSVQAGTQATRFVSGTVNQDLSMLYFSLIFAMSPMPAPPPSPVLSDIRLKTDIVPLGKRADGISLYRYRYLWSGVEHVGVMAQEVAEIRPEAVSRGADGFLRVDYGKL